MSDCDILFKYSCILSPTCGHSRLSCTHLCTVAGSSVTCMLRFSTVNSQSLTISTFAIHLLITLSFVNAFVCACCCMDSPVGVVTWAKETPLKCWHSSACIFTILGMSETRVVHFPCYAAIHPCMQDTEVTACCTPAYVCMHVHTRLYIRCRLTCL